MEFICEICKMNCYIKDLLEAHLRLHKQNPYYCLDCGCTPFSFKCFRSFREFKSHMKRHHNEIVCETFM